MADYDKVGLLTVRDGRILLCRKRHSTSLLILPGGCRERRAVRGREAAGLPAGAVGLCLACARAVPGLAAAATAVAVRHLPVAYRAAGCSGHGRPGVSWRDETACRVVLRLTSAAYAAQSPEEIFCHWTAALMRMPSAFARIAAGTSAAGPAAR